MANENGNGHKKAGAKPARLKRSGASRLHPTARNARRGPQRRKILRRATAAEILGVQDECRLWDRLLHSDDDRLVLAALKYLTDRRDGKSYPAANPSWEEKPQVPVHDSRSADSKIAAALDNLLPSPSSQVTLEQDRRDPT